MSLVQISPDHPKPEWLKLKLNLNREKHYLIKGALRKRGLVTVCEEAHCPNIDECWANEGTATFMVMGDTCTRGCNFCNVKTGDSGKSLDPLEPAKLASAIAEMGLDYAVITSVDRDDLPDQGAHHFAACIKEIKRQRPETLVEVLIPDFRGDSNLVKLIVDAHPDVIAHNLETTEPLQHVVRDPRANYSQSLSVLKAIKELDPKIVTKSALMLGLGETDNDVLKAMDDLLLNRVQILTLGQYLRPSAQHIQVKEYVHPDKFKEFEKTGLEKGFSFVVAGPFVRSSYKAGDFFVKNLLKTTSFS